jgi:hypothetical protein
MKSLSERISALSPEQRTLFEARLKKKGLDPVRAVSEPRDIPRRKQQDYCPLSYDQERLWAADANEPGNPAYNIYSVSRLRGPLDVKVMGRVVNEIVRRHDILRTTFKVVGGNPLMVIAPELELVLPVEDLSPILESEREHEALRRANKEVARQFDLSRGPLIRVGIFKLAGDDHVIHLTLHHTIIDRWSAAIVEQELCALYAAFSRGEPSPLPDPTIQFADFASWQRDWLQGDVIESQLSYWREQLAGAPLALGLPTDHPRPAVQTFRGARDLISLPGGLLGALKALSKQEGATMFMTALAAYNLLLYRCSKQRDILVGLTVSNRERPETVGMLGYLLNMVTLRTRLSDRISFRELLRRVREAVVGAFAHQDFPLELLIKELKPGPDRSRNPIFQVSYIYLDFPELRSMNELGLSVTHLAADNGSSRFDLTLALSEKGGGLETIFEYNTDLFEAATIRRMLVQLQSIFEAVVEGPERPIAEMP